MDNKYIDTEFDRFFVFDSADRSIVTSASAKLFAEHIVNGYDAEKLKSMHQESEVTNLIDKLDHYKEHLGSESESILISQTINLLERLSTVHGENGTK